MQIVFQVLEELFLTGAGQQAAIDCHDSTRCPGGNIVGTTEGATPIKVGVLHPVTGALAYSGQQCRLGALLAIEDINKAGGIKSLGGAPLQAVLGDAQSRPKAGSAEVEKMNEAGV